mgnify:CR=1 FL=1
MPKASQSNRFDRRTKTKVIFAGIGRSLMTQHKETYRETWAFVLQRLSALVLAPLVIVHLGVMIYAVQGGLSTSEMLGRTQSSFMWPVMYGLFFVAAGVHGALGFRNILQEMTTLPGRSINTFALGLLALVLIFGLQTIRAIA